MIPKFRVFCKWHKCIEEVFSITFLGDDIKIEAECNGSDFVLMQSTGLFDIHGVEIFEGDVLEVRSELFTNFGTEATGEYSTEIKQVIWILDSWGTKRLGSDYESKQLSITSKYGTVIGNIYENPELLEDV